MFPKNIIIINSNIINTNIINVILNTYHLISYKGE